jgi:hypothetical protein
LRGNERLRSLYREHCGKQIDHLSQYFRLMGTIGVGKSEADRFGIHLKFPLALIKH